MYQSGTGVGNTDGVELRGYWLILRRRWWILLLGIVGAALVAYIVSNTTTPMYEARSKVLVQGGQSPGIPTASDIAASQELAQQYSDLISTRPTLQRVVQTLSLPYGPGGLSGRITVLSPRSLIEITARDPDPELAAEIANAIAETFIEDFRDRQFTQIAQFQASLGQYGITQDASIIAAQAATLTTLSIAERAIPALTPSSPQTVSNVIIAAVLGLVLAGFLALLIEYLDDSVKSPDEVRALAGVATLGLIPLLRSRNGQPPMIGTEEHTRSPFAESYKFLRTNLEFAALGEPEMRSLLITSSGPREGKTVTSTNLAITIAKEGKSVVLVDCDLRNPQLHRFFNLGEHKGLTNYLIGAIGLDEALAPTTIEGLRVMPTGPLPPDPTIVLRSTGMRELIQQLKAMVDLVVVDSAPVLAVTDPLLVARLTDGVLLVIDEQSTRREALKRTMEHLRQANLSVTGAVVNRMTEARGGYYSHYYSYYSSEEDSKRNRNSMRRLLSRIKGTRKKDRKDVGNAWMKLRQVFSGLRRRPGP